MNEEVNLALAAEAIIELAVEIHDRNCAHVSFDQALRLAQDLYMSADMMMQQDMSDQPDPLATFNDSV